MTTRKLGIIADCIENENPVATLEKIKATGFDCFFTHSLDKTTVRALKRESEILGLDFEFIHGPLHGANSLWQSESGDVPLLLEILQTIETAAENGVSTVIVHVSSGWTPPPVCDTGLARFDTIVKRANELKITIAFENLRKLGNLACVMERYEKESHVAFCYDCGHEHCYTKTVPFIDLYHDKLLCTHLHDNFGYSGDLSANDDLHLLPFDGNFDFKKMKDKLDFYGYGGSLMLEVFDHRRYRGMSADDFLALAFARAEKIRNL